MAERIPEPSSPPSFKPRCTAPHSTSFYRLVLATCFSSCILSPHSLSISLWKGHFSDSPSLLFSSPSIPPSPFVIFLRAFLVVCPSSAELSFLGELTWKDCFSCVYTETSRSHTIGRFDDVPFGTTGAHIRFEFQLMRYIVSINAATVISHQVGSQTWSHHVSFHISSEWETQTMYSRSSYGLID